MHLLTIIIESFNDLSASCINYSAPPLNRIVADKDFGQSLKILYLSAPIYISSNLAQVPKDSFFKLLTVVYIIAPVAFATLLTSSYVTLPAQNNPLSAKYYVARSPIGNLDKTILAPESTMIYNFS